MESKKSGISSSSSTKEQGITILSFLSSGDPGRAPNNGHITEFLPGRLSSHNFNKITFRSDFEEYGWYERLNVME